MSDFQEINLTNGELKPSTLNSLVNNKEILLTYLVVLGGAKYIAMGIFCSWKENWNKRGVQAAILV